MQIPLMQNSTTSARFETNIYLTWNFFARHTFSEIWNIQFQFYVAYKGPLTTESSHKDQ